MRKIILAALLSTPLMAQVSNPSIISVTVAPTGACAAGLPNQQVVSTGIQYSCQGGTWAAFAAGGSLAWSSLTNATANLSLANGNFTSTFANTLAQASGAYTLQNTWSSGTVNVPSIYQGFRTAYGFGTLYASMNNLTAVDVPSGATTTETDAVSAYVTCESTVTDCVPFSGTTMSGAAGAKIWGANFNVWDNGLSTTALGLELDAAISNTATTGELLQLYPLISPGVTYHGIHFTLPSAAVGRLTDGILFDTGVASKAIAIGQIAGGGASMPLEFGSSTGTGDITFDTNSTGNFSFSKPISYLSATAFNGNPALTVTSSYANYPPLASMLAPSLSTSKFTFFRFGVDATTVQDNAVELFYYAGAGSANNYAALSTGNGTLNNLAWFPNGGVEIGETTTAAPPANGLKVGTTGQFSVQGTGDISAPTFTASVLYSAAGTPLPTCAAGNKGQEAVVSDATSPAYLGTYTSGGAVVAPVMCNGTSWVTY